MGLSTYGSKPLSWWLRTPLYASRLLRHKARLWRDMGPRSLQGKPVTLSEDGLATVHNISYLRTPEFTEAFSHSTESGLRIRTYTAIWAARQALGVEGDFVECGVHLGGMTRAIMHTLHWADVERRFWLVDTWAGFPDSQKQFVSQGARDSAYSDVFEQVKERFSSFPNVTLVRGIVPDVLPEVHAEKIAYLCIDLNSAEPEIEALEYFWGRLTPGAVVLLDDYCFAGYERQHDALNAFAHKHNISILGMPTGQGLIIKQSNGTR